MMKILIPVDGSVGAEKAVRFAISIAEGKEKEITLLNVQPSYNLPNMKIFFNQEQIKAFQQEGAQEVFARSLEITDSLSTQVSTLLRIGDPGKEICAEAKASGTDLIVMGYRGLGGIKRTIMGSVATHVLHETPCPVLIVP
ncbi:MAG: universal stress protein [Syntrophomonadaceae bacterium]|nr:universal stress protein [Syntrophomonadaceae bacterium]